MIGAQSLADKPDAQCLLCADFETYQRVIPLAPEFVCCLYEAGDKPEDYAKMADRDVICINADYFALDAVAANKPARLRTIKDSFTVDITTPAEFIAWCKVPGRLQPYSEQPAERVVPAAKSTGEVEGAIPRSVGGTAEPIESDAQAAISLASSPTGASSPPVASDPSGDESAPTAAIPQSKQVEMPSLTDVMRDGVDHNEKLAELLEILDIVNDTAFSIRWTALTDSQRSAIGMRGFDRYREVNSHVTGAIERAKNQNKRDDRLNAALEGAEIDVGDSEPVDIGEPPEYLSDSPDDDLPRVNGHDSAIWSRDLSDDRDEWPEAIDVIGNATLAEIAPHDLLPGWLADYVCDNSMRTGTDRGIGAAAAIGGLAAWCHETWGLQVKTNDSSWVEHARLWFMVYGESACGKSPGLKSVLKPLFELDMRCRKDAVAALKQYISLKNVYEGKLAAWEKAQINGDAAGDRPAEPEKISVDYRMFSETNAEGMRSLLELAPKAWLFSDELSSWAAGMGKYSASKDAGLSERAMFLQSFEGGPYHALRATRPVSLDSLSLGIVGGITPSALRSSLGGAALAADGLVQRFCVSHARLQGPDANNVPDEIALAQFAKAGNNLRVMRPVDSMPLRVSANAYGLFQEFVARVMVKVKSELYPATCQSHLNKMRSFCSRIALTLHLVMRAGNGQECNRGEVIDDECMSMAIAICEQWLIPHTVHFWNELGENTTVNPLARKVATFLAAQGKNTVKTRDISANYSRTWPFLDQRTKVACMSALHDLGWTRPSAKAKITAGLASEYEINPAVLTMYAGDERVMTERKRRNALGAKLKAMRDQSPDPLQDQDYRDSLH